MTIEVFGTEDAKYRALVENVNEAAELLGIDYDLHEVTDALEIADRGVRVTPALAIEGEIVLSGEIPDETELMALLSHACAGEA